MRNWRSRGQYTFALGLLAVIPRQCASPPGGGPASGGVGNVAGHSAAGSGGNESAGDAGQSGEAGLVNSAGEAGAGTSAAGEAGLASSGGEAGTAGAAGSPGVPDRVTEPLLGCSASPSGKATPGTFEFLPPPPTDTADDPVRWLTDWSGDGRSAVGYYTTPSDGDGDGYGAITFQWETGRGFSVVSKVRIENADFQEQPTARTSCDGSVIALRLGQGDVLVQGGNMPPVERQPEPLYHDKLLLSEDGSSIAFRTGIPDVIKPWTEWHSTKGAIGQTVAFDEVNSISADGLTLFGVSDCFHLTCTPPAIFRWRPPGNEETNIGAPSSVVAADGESVVYGFNANFIGIWRESGTESISCGKACDPVAWSSRAQVLLVNTEDGFLLWTKVHGFRTIESLLTVPPGWQVLPTDLSLDGWTVTGTATTDFVTFPYFRATLNANALE